MGLKLVLSSLLLLFCVHGTSSHSHPITSLFTLGGAYIDTGNFLVMASPLMPVWSDKPPYGMTYFGHPTGRLSDGRIITDFITEWFGLPLLRASLLHNTDVSKGVNFATGGATAIDVDFYEKSKLVPFKLLNNSLNVQLGWFDELKPEFCKKTTGTGHKGCFSESLFFIGEFGVNDYNLLWNVGKSEDEVKSYVPHVVENIAKAVERLIEEGAIFVVVPGNPPLGCTPTMLTIHPSLNKTVDYDQMGCLSNINRVAKYHNSKLRAALGVLRGKYPHAAIIFADFYAPIISILENPSGFGVADADALRACCGGGGKYNVNPTAMCGMPGVTACKDPSAYVSWDGVHYTEATYEYIANGWLFGPFAHPPIMNAIHANKNDVISPLQNT